MKNKYYLFAVSLCLLMACGSNGGSNGGSNEGSEEVSVTGSDGKIYTNYREACRNGDFDAAYRILEKKREAFEKFKEDNQLEKWDSGLFGSSYDESNKQKYDAMVNHYEDGMNYVFNAEMLFLTSQNTEESSSRILYLLAEYHIPGTPTAPGGEYEGGSCDEAKRYIAGVSRFNSRCNSVLDMAIAQKNEKLARGVVRLIKANVDVSYESSRSLSISSKGVNNTDIDLAKKKLDDAIKSGAFK